MSSPPGADFDLGRWKLVITLPWRSRSTHTSDSLIWERGSNECRVLVTAVVRHAKTAAWRGDVRLRWLLMDTSMSMEPARAEMKAEMMVGMAGVRSDSGMFLWSQKMWKVRCMSLWDRVVMESRVEWGLTGAHSKSRSFALHVGHRGDGRRRGFVSVGVVLSLLSGRGTLSVGHRDSHAVIHEMDVSFWARAEIKRWGWGEHEGAANIEVLNERLEVEGDVETWEKKMWGGIYAT
ncbi:hypothetical protein BDN67DRAFT_1043302 [Paxillus ammoniavirescens]|nr:hypothetical protein BDN67DRAFT_1043302 [Paxillus ammoniavirescens]